MRVLVEVTDARGVERGQPSLDAVDLIAEAEQIFGKIGAVLAVTPRMSATRFGFEPS
jgi:hypothetical protein